MIMNGMMDAIMETTFLPKPPHIYSDPYLRTISMSARVGVASLYEININQGNILAMMVGSATRYIFLELYFLVFGFEPSKLKAGRH